MVKFDESFVRTRDTKPVPKPVEKGDKTQQGSSTDRGVRQWSAGRDAREKSPSSPDRERLNRLASAAFRGSQGQPSYEATDPRHQEHDEEHGNQQRTDAIHEAGSSLGVERNIEENVHMQKKRRLDITSPLDAIAGPSLDAERTGDQAEAGPSMPRDTRAEAGPSREAENMQKKRDFLSKADRDTMNNLRVSIQKSRHPNREEMLNQCDCIRYICEHTDTERARSHLLRSLTNKSIIISEEKAIADLLKLRTLLNELPLQSNKDIHGFRSNINRWHQEAGLSEQE